MVVYAVCGFLARCRQFQKFVFGRIILRARSKQSIITCLLSIIIGVVHVRIGCLAKVCAIANQTSYRDLAVGSGILTEHRKPAMANSRKTVCFKNASGTASVGVLPDCCDPESRSRHAVPNLPLRLGPNVWP